MFAKTKIIHEINLSFFFFTQDKVAVLDLCTVVLSIITCIRLSPTRGAGNSLFDAQLHAWKIPPAQFRPLKTMVEKLLKTVQAWDNAQRNSSENSMEVSTEGSEKEVGEGFIELAQLLSSF